MFRRTVDAATSHVDSFPGLPMDPDPAGPRPAHHRVELLLVVFAGGALGTWLRYAVGTALTTRHDGWPVATFVVNLSAAFVLGLLLESLTRLGGDTGGRLLLRLFIGTGICGALSTYSTFAVEVVLLVRDAHAGLAAAYAGATVAAGLLAVSIGIGLGAGGHRMRRRDVHRQDGGNPSTKPDADGSR